MTTIIYEDENIIAVNKPAGLLVHPAQAANHKSQIPNPKPETLVDWLINKYPEIKNVGEDPNRPGIVHRLDKDTSGVLIIAKNQKTFEFLKKQFKDKKIKKTYTVLVKGEVKKQRGVIDLPIGRSLKSPLKKSASEKAKGKLREAVTEFKITCRLCDSRQAKYTLLEVYPKTGRTHQIRVHLQAIGHPVLCDKLYTKTPDCPFGLKRQFLHARSLELNLPNGSRIKLEADLPEDLQTTLKLLEECDKKEKC